ncbi:HlyD family type I secretion periplasmic adaptor subunit [Amphritea sp. HPY]|uniref:HlyD family type I secretion periplasmic adaptor subunit n=1 Tax=Amphritea sp. HPY TaxID=3421652 RepID=UPI003D7EF85C
MSILQFNSLPLRLDVNRGPRKAIVALLLLIASFLLFFLLWASVASLDITVFGSGRVVPSAQLQVVQNLEGGIISDIHVRQGDLVEKDQLLLEIDNIGFTADLEELRANYQGALAVAARYTAETEGRVPVYPEELANRPDLIRQENALFLERALELKSTLDVLQRQVEQRRLAQDEIQQQINSDRRNLALIREEIRLNKPLVERGATSKVEFIKLQREEGSLIGKIEGLKVAYNRTNAEIQEAQARVSQQEATFNSEARSSLNELQVKIAAMKESIVGSQDRVARRQVKAPVSGIVNRVLINTIGGVSRPGDDLVEIVPVEDELQIEMRVKPADIGFITAAQPAIIRFTAYDASIFGALDGHVQQIGADTLTDDQGEVYYQVVVKAGRNHMGSKEKPLPIIPGMVAEVHVTTGQRTLLDYIIKPVTKLRQQALRER